MSTFFRLSVVAATVVMAATMNAVAGDLNQVSEETISVRISPIARFTEEKDPSYNKKWYEEDYRNPWKNPCRDSGSDCKEEVVIDGVEAVEAYARPVSGGYLVTAKMVPARVELATGVDVGEFQPTAGSKVEANQYVVRVSDTQISALKNVVVDFGGCVVDENLNVTKFVAVR